MKLGITRFVKMAAIAALMVFAASTAAWAQSGPCPSMTTSTITYTPDFSSNQNYLALNPANGTTPVFTGTSPAVALQLTANLGNQTGSAWYTTAQNVEQGFSTCFQFQFTNWSTPPADGIAFVIQNSPMTQYYPGPLTAIGSTGGNGGALGYGDADSSTNPSTGEGIPNSLAIEFDTYENSWDTSPSHVAVQSCGTGPNTSHYNYPCGGNGPSNSTLGAPIPVANMADGGVHTVIITYYPACPACPTPEGAETGTGTPANIHVILDGVDLYPSGVNVDLSTIGLGPGNTAYVGFTGATGGDWETQDILNWTFTPKAQTVVLSSTPTTLYFPNADNTSFYTFGLQATDTDPTLVTVQPNLMTRAACDAIVQKTFFPASCFVYQNAVANGQDAAVMFALTCPMDSSGLCSGINAEFSTGYTISKAGNPFFVYPGIAGLLNPFSGLLKSRDPGPDPQNPCVAPVFVSNQEDSFIDDNVFTSGKSGGTGSCWVATYDTPGEALPRIKISTPAIATYTQNQVVTASYSCIYPSTSRSAGNTTGPYLSVASSGCTQNQAPAGNVNNTNSCNSSGVIPQNTLACTGKFDTSVVGLHLFAVTAVDSGGNSNVQLVAYLVKKN
jgi:Bacterial lectin